jgi:hypothetical protein
MIPWPRRHLSDDGDGLNVLVPGLMGIGFLISLLVLVSDGIARILPHGQRRRAAMLERTARGRASDVSSIRSGVAPRPGEVNRQLRSRPISFALGLVAATIAYAIVASGVYIAENHVGVDRQVWVVVWALVLATPLFVVAFFWLAAAATGSRAPAWLRWAHVYWPVGRYRDYERARA